MSCSNWPTLFLVASLFLWQICLCDDGVYAWRKGASVVVMNDQLFIQGGISSKPKRLWTDGWAIENQTFAIPLGRSWVKSDIDMAQYANENTMYKNISADNPSMWTKDDKQIIFWGGAGSFGRGNTAAASPRPWAYTPSGSSGQHGSLEQAASQRPTDKTTQSPLYRTGGGSWTQCNGLGFYMGGFVGSATDGGFPHRLNGTGQRALTGLLIYDIAAGTWRNRTTQGSGFGSGRMEGTHVSGQAVCLPTLGKDSKGIVLFLAGYHGTWESRFTREFVRMDQISFYDIGSDTFHTQRTTGTAPKQREQTCAVAAKAKNSNTYEVVLFGGSGATPADTYILAVPGFEWFPVAPVAGGTSLADEGRRDHACAVVGKGGRQMLAVGGSEAKDSVNDVWKRRDPWGDNSLHVFDMTDLRWKSDYAHDAADYQQPAMVRGWYRNSGLKNVTWGSKDTQALFAQVIETPLTGETSAPNSTTTPGDSSPPIGPIVGGVIGGLAFLALVGCVVFYCVWYKPRRKARGATANAQQQQDDSQQSHNMGQMHYYTPGHHQLDGDAAAKWSAVSSSPQTQPQSAVYTELPASPYPLEMQGSQAGGHLGSPKTRFEQERGV